MKVVFTVILGLMLASGLPADQSSSDWIQVQLKNGTLLNGHVVQVTDKNVHLVGASINRLIPKEQLSEQSLLRLADQFPVTVAAESAESTTAEKLKTGLQTQRTVLYQNTSDVYSPVSRSYRRYSYGHGLYQRTYYLPGGCSLAYPVYQHYYRPHYRFPRWSVQIDL